MFILKEGTKAKKKGKYLRKITYQQSNGSSGVTWSGAIQV